MTGLYAPASLCGIRRVFSGESSTGPRGTACSGSSTCPFPDFPAWWKGTACRRSPPTRVPGGSGGKVGKNDFPKRGSDCDSGGFPDIDRALSPPREKPKPYRGITHRSTCPPDTRGHVRFPPGARKVLPFPKDSSRETFPRSSRTSAGRGPAQTVRDHSYPPLRKAGNPRDKMLLSRRKSPISASYGHRGS